VGIMKDSFSFDGRPFRGVVEGGRFTLTRRVRGRRVRVQLEGELRPMEQGGTEVRASIAAPLSLRAGFLGGSTAMLAMATVGGVQSGHPWLGLAVAPAIAFAGWLGNRLFTREQFQTFRALRESLPEEPVARLEPVSVAAHEQDAAAAAGRVRE
jgi:hypothetical protein